MDKNIINITESKRCLLCRKAKCAEACPVHTDVPSAMKLYREGRPDLAGELLFENNPLSAVTSRICDWDRFCFGHCILNAKKLPIHWFEIEQEISAAYLKDLHVEAGRPVGKKVAVIGAGPAGITAAFMLRRLGVDVELYDDNPRIGGVLRYGIPGFRLDKSYIDEYERILTELGVELHTGIKVGTDLSLPGIVRGSDAVFLSAGAWKPRKLAIPGESSPRVIYALEYLRDPEKFALEGRVIVIGGGNVTMDAARTASRMGCDAHIYYRKTYENMPASYREVEATKADGVTFHTFEVPVEVRDEKVAVMLDCENYTAADGRIATKMLPGTEHNVPFDYMIVAISESVDYEILGEMEVNKDSKGRPVADELQSVGGKIFAAGDYLSGPSTVVEAVASAKKAVDGIISYIGLEIK